MRNLVKRVKRLERQRFDVNGLVPHSQAWFDHWTDKVGRHLNGEDVDLTGLTLDYIDAMMAQGDTGEEQPGGRR